MLAIDADRRERVEEPEDHEHVAEVDLVAEATARAEARADPCDPAPTAAPPRVQAEEEERAAAGEHQEEPVADVGPELARGQEDRGLVAVRLTATKGRANGASSHWRVLINERPTPRTHLPDD